MRPPEHTARARRPVPPAPALPAAVLLAAALLVLAGCTDSGTDAGGDTATDTASSSSSTSSGSSAATAGLDTSLFVDGALVGEPTTEDCTLSGGAEATCWSITVAGDPTDHEVGPFCPPTITSGADEGGLWFDGENQYDLDGEFIEGLAQTYDDDAWKMYDDEGNVMVTETQEEFEAAARPDVDPDLANHCIEGRFEWLEGGEAIPTTVQIPTEPVAADASGSPGALLGVTLDGVRIDASAPVDAILGAYTIASFDDCGGHFNPTEGYHLHGAVGCSEVGEAAEGETAQFGYALDGYAVHSPLEDEADADLDECGGHTTDEVGYHYHANPAAENQVITCLVGQTVDSGDAGGPPGGGPAGGGGPPDNG